jgi:pilus assembly protein CpaE
MNLKLLLVTNDDKRGEDLLARLARAGGDPVCGSTAPENLAAALRVAAPDAVLADLHDAPQAVLDAFEALPAPRPALLAFGPASDGLLVLRALRLGAREFLPGEVSSAELTAALEKLARAAEPVSALQSRGQILAVMGGKGGVGATVIACQLATALQRLGRRVVAVDLGLPLGDLDLHFDLRPRYTLAQLADPGQSIDAAYLQSISCVHASGVRVIAAPQCPEEAEAVTAKQIANALEVLRSDCDFVVVDLARTWSEPLLQALDVADLVLLVTLLDVPTLHHVRRQLAVLERLRIPAGKIRVIANRASSADAVGESEVQNFIGFSPSARIPNDFPTVAASVNRGVSIAEVAPRSAIAHAFAELANQAHLWCGLPSPVDDPKRSLGRMFSFASRRSHGTR